MIHDPSSRCRDDPSGLNFVPLLCWLSRPSRGNSGAFSLFGMVDSRLHEMWVGYKKVGCFGAREKRVLRCVTIVTCMAHPSKSGNVRSGTFPVQCQASQIGAKEVESAGG